LGEAAKAASREYNFAKPENAASISYEKKTAPHNADAAQTIFREE
jgi:hypothetical protein